MNKKSIISIIIVLLIIAVAIISVTLYKTFAIGVIPSDTYDISLNNSSESIVIPANSFKTVIYHITNTNKGKVKYGVAYTGNDISVKVYNNSEAKETDIIDYGENKFIKLHISNSGTTESTVTLKTILGYENGGDLIVPSGYTLVTEIYATTTLREYITNLYTNASKTVVTNNDIEYNYATSESLMNDRLGGTTANYDAGNIRYYGASPNNYVYFNCSDYSNQSSDTCELWRIIGIFGNKVKIIRNESIGSYAWDNKPSGIGTSTSSYGSNDWTDARLMMLLNPGYEEASDVYSYEGSLYWNSKSGTCYAGSSSRTTSCDFTSTGLKNDETRNMIEEVTWNLGGWNSESDVYSNKYYEYERGTTVYPEKPTSWTGKIALMYPSDYGYATDFTKCTENNYDSSTDSYACRTNDWLFNSAYQWLLTPRSSDDFDAWYVSSTGHIYAGSVVCNAWGVRPVLYLNSKLVIESGDGSASLPYKLIVN